MTRAALATPSDGVTMATILPFARAPAAPPMVHDPPAALDADRSPSGDTGPAWALLMLATQDGDRVAYHCLLQAIVPYVRAIARRYLGRGEDVEDAVQDVLLIVHSIRHTYERGRPFKPWLGTIASRRCIDLLRRRAHRLRHEIDSDHDAPERAGTGLAPDEAVMQLHASAQVQHAVAGLPARQREAIELLKLKELSLNEAAAASDQSIGSLKVACHRAIKSLKGALGAEKSSRHD